ncbi:MAG: hypothetical protein GY718_09680 [Lentisphaerae bacterium]|nr:hypothetical protein [Lentisphaerota bacterium]
MNKNEFLEKLATLCEKYKATIGYTIDDDGIHIDLDYKEIFCGFLSFEDAPTVLRAAKDV